MEKCDAFFKALSLPFLQESFALYRKYLFKKVLNIITQKPAGLYLHHRASGTSMHAVKSAKSDETKPHCDTRHSHLPLFVSPNQGNIHVTVAFSEAAPNGLCLESSTSKRGRR